MEALDKLLTESLKKNIPASGLHLFGINQLEEEDMTASKFKDIWFIDFLCISCLTLKHF